MIRASKYLDLDICVLAVAERLLSKLTENRVVALAELEEWIQHATKEEARLNLVPALCFLYLAGTIEYSETDDLVIRTQSSGGMR